MFVLARIFCADDIHKVDLRYYDNPEPEILYKIPIYTEDTRLIGDNDVMLPDDDWYLAPEVIK